jgi:hypothetical protein
MTSANTRDTTIKATRAVMTSMGLSFGAIRSGSIQDCNDRRPAWHTANGDQLGPSQRIQAPGGREPGEAELGPILQRQLELRRSVPTRQEPADRRNLEGSPREPGGREPPAPRDRPIQRPMLRPGLRLQEIQDGDDRFTTRLLIHFPTQDRVQLGALGCSAGSPRTPVGPTNSRR